jgi:transcriptional regulator PpsR
LSAGQNFRETASRDAGDGRAQKAALTAPSRARSIKLLGALDSETASHLVAAAADIAVVIDGAGVVREVSAIADNTLQEVSASWIGQRWIDTVTVETRPKVEALIRDALLGECKWRQVNHRIKGAADAPILYSAIKTADDGQIVAIGRDLRPNAALQQRLVEAQQSMERDYWRLRHVETRYRLLFQIASEAVVILDAQSQKVTEANPAAGKLLGDSESSHVGRVFPYGFDDESTAAIQSLLAKVRVAAVPDEIVARTVQTDKTFKVSASLFLQEHSASILVRLSPLTVTVTTAAVPAAILSAVENAPDAFVVTDTSGRVLVTNRAFVDLAQLTSDEQARGESLERWVGQSGVDFKVLVSNLLQHGSVRLFATTLRGEHDSTAEVEISAVSVPHGEHPCMGFTIRNIGKRLNRVETRARRDLPRSVEQLTELVGRVSLKDLVGETTDMIEKLCIEAALELTQDNRAAAAEMLGLSRQSLYVKLRRYGLGDLPADEAGQDLRPN